MFSPIARGLCVILLTATCSSFCVNSLAAVIYDESVLGDLPPNIPLDIPSIPDVLVLTQGTNEVKGDVGAPGDEADGFLFEVPIGLRVKDINVKFAQALSQPLLFKSVKTFAPPGQSIRVVETESIRIHQLIDEEEFSLFDLIPIEGPMLEDLTSGVYGVKLSTSPDPSYTIEIIAVPEPSALCATLLGLVIASGSLRLSNLRNVRRRL